MSKLIVIVGATGVQGSSVAHTFLQFPEWRVRGISRNPSSEVAQALAAKGVEIVKADLDDKQSLFSAFQGASAIFANTDFFAPLYSALADETLSPGRSPKEYAYDVEVSQGVNIAEAAASPEVQKTLERFVYSSLSDARKWSSGKFTTVFHFDSKAEVIRVIQTRFPELAAKMSKLQMGHYITQWKSFAPLAPQKQLDGSYLVSRTTAPNLKYPFVATHLDSGAFVKALVDAPPGKTLLGVSQGMTWPEWLVIWGQIHGVETGFKQISTDEFFQGVPGPLKEELADAFDYINEFGYTGGDPNVLTPEQLDSKISLTSMEEYIKGEDWSSVIKS